MFDLCAKFVWINKSFSCALGELSNMHKLHIPVSTRNNSQSAEINLVAREALCNSTKQPPKSLCLSLALYFLWNQLRTSCLANNSLNFSLSLRLQSMFCVVATRPTISGKIMCIHHLIQPVIFKLSPRRNFTSDATRMCVQLSTAIRRNKKFLSAASVCWVTTISS